MYFIEGCSSPNSSSGDGASLKTLRGMGKWNTPKDIEISEFMRLRKMIIIVITNNNFNCVALFKINVLQKSENLNRNQPEFFSLTKKDSSRSGFLEVF